MASDQKEQVKPLAPSSFHFRGDDQDDEAISKELKLGKRKYIMCCGCVSAIFLIIAVTILVLNFTVFHIKSPDLRLNGITILNANFSGDQNITLIADVSVKNPNAATFTYGNTATTIYYDGTVVGDGRTPPGKARARRTLRLNVTVEIVPSKVTTVPRFSSDVSRGALNISSHTRVEGKVNILKIRKKKVVVELNCTMEYDISGSKFKHESCGKSVKL